MTIGTRTAGAWAAGSTSLSPALPTSVGAGDMMILFVGAKPFNCTINQPTGWTRIGTQQTNGSTASGIDTGSVTWSVFYRAWQSGDAAPSVSVTSGNVSLACINGFTKTASAWVTPTAYFGSDTTSGTDYSITAASSSGAITSGDYLLHGTVIAGNNATFGTPTLTATSATIGASTESPATEGATATGNDLEASAAWAACTAGTSTADAVCGWTLSAAQTGGSALVRLREDSTQTLTPSLFTSSTNDFYTATVSPGGVTLTPSLYTNTQTFYDPTVSASGGAQTLTQDSRYDNTTTFYTATVTPGAVTLTTTRYDSSNSFYIPTVAPGAVTLTATRLDNTSSFYTPTVTVGTVTLTPSRYDNSQTFYSATIIPGDVSLSATRYDNSQTFYVPTVTASGGPQTLTQASRFDNSASFYTPTVSQAQALVASLFTNSSTFYNATVGNQYPNPGQVLAGIQYGPTGTEFMGTFVGFTNAIKYDLSTGRLVKILTDRTTLSL